MSSRTLFMIFACWGAVAFLNAIYPALRSAILNARPAHPRVHKPAPYSDEDRARDAARAEFLQREARKDPTLNRIMEEERLRRSLGSGSY